MLGWQSTQILCFGDYWVFCTQLIFSGKINVYFRFVPKKQHKKQHTKKTVKYYQEVGEKKEGKKKTNSKEGR